MFFCNKKCRIYAACGVSQTPIYKDYCEEYKDGEKDFDKIHKAMKLIVELTEGRNNNFVNKKTQMYSLFSVMFDFCENAIEITDEMKVIFDEFVKAYSIFKNEYSLCTSI